MDRGRRLPKNHTASPAVVGPAASSLRRHWSCAPRPLAAVRLARELPSRRGNFLENGTRSAAVKWIGLGLLLVIAAGWTASSISLSWLAPANSLTPWDWRRTRNGWQQAEWLMPPPVQQKPTLHPSVVAMLELLLSIGGLAAFPAQGRGFRSGEETSVGSDVGRIGNPSSNEAGLLDGLPIRPTGKPTPILSPLLSPPDSAEPNGRAKARTTN